MLAFETGWQAQEKKARSASSPGAGRACPSFPVSFSTSTSGAVENAGNSNPDNDLRFDATLGSTGGYIFNLKTTGLSTGMYKVNFTVTGDSFVYAANFEVK
jgi:hypothetical protein